MSWVNIYFCIKRDGKDIKIEVEADIEPIIIGKTYGSPESCYPDEGGEIEILFITHNKKSFECTKEEIEYINGELFDLVTNQKYLNQLNKINLEARNKRLLTL